MKKSLVLLILALFSVACHEESNKELDSGLNNIDFTSFAKSIKFFQDFNVQVKNNQEIKETLIEVNNEVNKAINTEKEINTIVYTISFDGKELKYKNFKTLKNKESNQKYAKGGPTLDTEWEAKYTCPDGQHMISTCYSEDCVTKTLKSLGAKMKVGDDITIHRSRINVKICTNIE